MPEAAGTHGAAEEKGLLVRLHRWGTQRPKVYYIAPPSVWAVAIYVGSLADLRGAGLQLPGNDVFQHLVAYAGLALLTIRGWHREKMPPFGLHLTVGALCLVYGLMIETLQWVSPHRTFQPRDLAADAAGALLGLVLWHLLMLRWGKRTRLYPGLLRPDFKDHPTERRRGV